MHRAPVSLGSCTVRQLNRSVWCSRAMSICALISDH